MERSEIRILVVDPAEEVRGSLVDFLGQAGFKAEMAKSGFEARHKAAQHHYYLLLIDYALPDESGLEVMDQLSAAKACPPVILMTGQPSVEMATAGMQRGVRNYLIKPIGKDELVNAVETVLANDGLLINADHQFLRELGWRLKLARQRANLTMRQLGSRINISQAQISQIEAGLSAPSLTTLFRLSQALRVRLSELLKGF